ncbi:ankyrin repeat domain-containing protein [Streptomyces sp. NPDC091268]|uniref:ankyrin repeat domain-containing protein n=1 Tax=Streptomyces sp. NPDC091268 TaxID=3365979 RepID=UPI0037F75C13
MDPFENLWTPAHQAVESSEYTELIRLLDEGADVNEVCCGMTLLEHAIDLEGDSALQSGTPIDSRLTVILLAYGADLRPQPPGTMSALDLADHYGHDIAYRLINRLASVTAGSSRSGLLSWRRSRKD